MDDVWKLESSQEDLGSDLLDNMYVQPALKGDRNAQSFLVRLWKEKWSSIKNKLETEGSVWYVWWMDGVHAFMRKKMKEVV